MADLQKFYNNAVSKGILDSDFEYNDFVEAMKDADERKSFYEFASSRGMKIGKPEDFYGFLDERIAPQNPQQDTKSAAAAPSQQAQPLNPRVKDYPAPTTEEEYQESRRIQDETSGATSDPNHPFATPFNADQWKDEQMLRNAEAMRRNAEQMSQRAGQMSIPKPDLSIAPKDGSIEAASKRMQQDNLRETNKRIAAQVMLKDTYSDRDALLDEMFPNAKLNGKSMSELTDKEKAAMRGALVQNDPYLKAADNILMGAGIRWNDARRQKGVSWSNVGNGIVSFAKDATRHLLGDMEGTLSFGTSDIRDAMIQRQVLKKIADAEAYDNPEKVLTPQEKVLYDAIATNIAVEIARQNDTSRWSKAGKITADMIPFIVDIMAGNALFKGMGNAARKAITQTVEKTVKNKLAKWLLVNGGDVATSAVESALTATILPRTYAKMYENAAQVDMNKLDMSDDYHLKIGGVDQQSLGKSWAQAEGEQIKEIFTETGGNFRLIGRALIDNPLGKKILKTPFGMVLKRFEGAQGSAGSRFASMTMYHGVLGEWLEELEGAIYDGNLKEFFTADTQLPMLLSFSVPAAFIGGLNAGQHAYLDAKYKSAGKTIDKLIDASAYVGPDKNTLKGQIMATLYQTPTENLPQAIGMCVEQVYPEEYKALMEGAPEKGNKAAELAYALKEYLASGTVLTAFDPDMLGGQIADVQAHREQMRQQATEAAQAAVQGITHEDGNIYRVGIKGKDDVAGYAFRGDLGLTQDDKGVLTTTGRNLVTIKLTDGTVEQVPADAVTILDAPASAQDRLQAITDHLFAKYANEDVFHVGDKVTIKQNGQVAPYTSTITAIDDAGVHVEVDDGQGGVMDMAIPHETAAEQLAVVEGETGDDIVTYVLPDNTQLRLRPKGDGFYEKEDGSDVYFNEDLANMGARRVEETPIQPESPETPEQPEAPHYPKDENGNPAWNQIEQAQAAQLLYDRYKGNKAKAQAVAEDMLVEAKKVKKMADKQQSHDLNLDKRDAENEQYDAMRTQADAAVKYWESVKLAISQIKTAEEIAAEEAKRAKDAALREQRRQTEEGLSGGQPAEKWSAAPKQTGNAVTRTLPDGTKISGHYVLTEAGAVTPSHDPFKNWNTSEGFPVTEDGRNINDRDYKNDKEAQQITMQIAQTYDGQAVEQVPVVSSEGIVYDGNGRTIAGHLAAANNTDAAYLQSLAENAANFGFTPEQLAQFNHPRVYLQLDEDMPYNTTTFAKFNAQEKKTQSSVNRAIANGKKLNDAARDGLLRIMDSYSSLDAFFDSETAAKDVIRMLTDTGILSEMDIPQWTNNTERGFVLSDEGRAAVRDLLIGALFDEQTIRMLGNDKGLKASILRAMPAIVENSRLGDYALTDNINEAIRLLYEARQANMAYKLFVRQGNLVDGYVKDRFSAFAMLMAEEMSAGVEQFRQVLNLYNNSARDEANNQGGLFEQRTPEDIKNEILIRYERETEQPAEPAAEQPANEETQPPVSSTPASNEPAAEQITLTDGRVVTPATVSHRDFWQMGNMSPIQRFVFAGKANVAQGIETKVEGAGFYNDARGALFEELPTDASGYSELQTILNAINAEYESEPNKTDEYEFAAQQAIELVKGRIALLDGQFKRENDYLAKPKNVAQLVEDIESLIKRYDENNYLGVAHWRLDEYPELANQLYAEYGLNNQEAIDDWITTRYKKVRKNWVELPGNQEQTPTDNIQTTEAPADNITHEKAVSIPEQSNETLRKALAKVINSWELGTRTFAATGELEMLEDEVRKLVKKHKAPTLQAALDAIDNSIAEQKARGDQWIDAENEQEDLFKVSMTIIGDLFQAEKPKRTRTTKTDNLTPLEAAQKRKEERETPKPRDNRETTETKEPKAEPVNTIFTDEAYEKAKARMKARLNRLNMGIDPEMVADQIVIAGYHVERGARKFADFARALIADFGDGIRQYARQMYNYLRDIPEGEPFRDEMDDYPTVMAFDLDNLDENGTEIVQSTINNENNVNNSPENLQESEKSSTFAGENNTAENNGNPEGTIPETSATQAAPEGANRESTQDAGEAGGLGSNRQADRTGLPNPQSSQFQQEAELERKAKANGTWLKFDDIRESAAKRLPTGKEADVFLSQDGKHVIKVVNYSKYSQTPYDYIRDRIDLFNLLFPETAYRLIGYTRNGNGQFCPVVEQPFIEGHLLEDYWLATKGKVKYSELEPMLERYMLEKHGMKKYGLDAYEDDKYRVQDLHLKNVRIDDEGNLYVIDAVPSYRPTNDGGGAKKTTFEKGQKVKYKNKVDGSLQDATIESVNADGTYNLTTSSPVFGDIHMQNISADRLSPIEETPKVEESPMMRQFRDIKKQYPDATLMFRVGDFYELYEEDAETASKILGITLTRLKDGRSFAGFPFHALDKYLPMLVRAGKRVAICDQLEDPKLTQKLVKRGVTELHEQQVMESAKAEVQPEQAEDERVFGTITNGTHTKTGADIVIVKPSQRVDNFAAINALAKKHHGRYNTRPHHAFVFDTEEDAEAFNREAGKLLEAEQPKEETPRASQPEKKQEPSQEPYMNHVWNMDDWAAAGDLRPAVDQEVVEEIIDTLRGNGMPTTDNGKFFQGQEADSHDRNGNPLYKTFEKIDGKWFYRGIKKDVHDMVNQPKQEEAKPNETVLETAQKRDMNKDTQMQLDLFADAEPEVAPQTTEETEPVDETNRTEFTEDDVTHGKVRLKNGEVKQIMLTSRSGEVIPGVGNTKPKLNRVYFTDGTDCVFEDIEAINVTDPLTPPKKKEKVAAAAAGDPNDPKRKFAAGVSRRLLDALVYENAEPPFRSILELRKFAREQGMTVDENGKDDIVLKELVEDAIVNAARQAIESQKYGGAKSKSAFNAIVRLYEMQPTIAQRSSNSIAMAQFSTPIPMGFVADMFAYKHGMEAVLEPTAGNGMLVFAIPADKVHVNELDEKRLANLRLQGFKVVTSQDATEPINRAVAAYDAVIANPPFGSSPAKEYDGKQISGLDPQIALNALSTMQDDGRAAIIIGGNMEYADNGSVKDHKAFWSYLYDHYNVKGVVDMDGQLYRKQGTTYDVRMILIDGRRSEAERAQTRVVPPVQSKAIEKVKTFDELYETVLTLLNSNNKTNGNEVLRTQSAPLSDNSQPSGQSVEGGHRAEPNADVANGQSNGGVRGNGRENSAQGTQQPSGRGVSQTPSSSSNQSAQSGNAGVSRPQADQGTTAPGADSNRRSTGDNGRVQSEPSDAVRTPADGVGLTKPQEKRNLTAEKLPYRPHSRAFSLQSVAPAAMVEAMDKVLAEIERTTGKSIDQFVADELGYDTVQAAHNALAAEQMDSVAMAIYQMSNGQSLIIGDQTGVGKGRQMAALIRWAVKRGKKPIFITQKADLFSDIYRDLCDIGSDNLRPFIFNSDGAMVDNKGVIVHKPLSPAEQRKIFASGVLPDEFDFAVLTYSQVNTGDKISRETKNKDGYKIASKKTQDRPSPKADFLRIIANDNYLFLDESHTAAGDSNIGAYIRSIIGTKVNASAGHGAKAVTFASATFAKRPDTMPMYALRTAMSAANVEQDKLIEIIEKGGVTLQEIMSRALTESGQMVRRERDMSDVQTDWKTIDDPEIVRKAREQYDRTITAFNAIIDFQTNYITPLIKAEDIRLAAMMETIGHKKGTKAMGIDNTPFASKTYNYTKQLMLALKVDAIVAEVEKEIAAGRHPVIALESTMEASIKDYAPGEVIDEPTFSASLLRGLDSCMQYTITDEEGKEVHGVYSPRELGPEGEKAYYELQKFIRESTKDIFISPLDAIIEGLKANGRRVGELTGRNTYVERTDDGKVVVRRRTDKDKKKMQRDFNSGKLDVLILNKSASTGISLHASEKFENKNQRSMIIAQPLSDINDYMQMIGRIDRTGQVHRGYYINLGLPVPAESRFLMMLSTKLKSLNANTTTSQDSESNEVDAPDLLNKYGSQVVIEYLRDNPTIYEKIGEPLKGGNGTVHAEELEEYKPSEDDALKITGRVALLSTKEQEEFYQEVVRRYNDLIRYLNDTGMNDLKITTMPLRAKTLARKVSSEGKDPNGTNPFAGNAYVEKVEMDVLRKPMKTDEVRKLMEQLCGEATKEAGKKRVEEIMAIVERETAEKLKAEDERYEKALQKIEKDIETFAAKVNANEKMEAAEKAKAIESKRQELQKAQAEKHSKNVHDIEWRKNYLNKMFYDFSVGKTYLVPDDLEAAAFNTSSPSIFCGYKVKDSKITPSTSFAVFATLDGRRKVEIKLSDPAVCTRIKDHTMQNYDAAQQTTLDNWDTQIPTQSRKEGYIMTGNILQAVSDSQDNMGNYPGQLVSYTDIDGNVHDGILMPDKWEPGQLRSAGAPISARFEDMKHGTVISADGKVTIRRGWGAPDFYYLVVPKSRKEGGQFYLNKDILRLLDGEFYTSKGQMEAQVPAENMPQVLDILSRLGVKAQPENNGSEFQITDLDYPSYANQTEAQQLATSAIIEALNDNTDLDVSLATDEEAAGILYEDNVEKSIRKEAAPKKTGIGYKVFRRAKDGKLYPPMVANPNGADTPVGVWLNADAAPIAEVSKTGRPKVKSTGSGTLAFRPGWHLGEIPYALQFNRLDENGQKTLFPKDFVWAEVEYAADNDYQEEAMKEGMNPSGKFQHSLAGLKRVPTNGFYRYRTNPNPATDPWIITGAMKVNRVLTNEEVDEIVRAAGREPQVREALITPDGTLYGWAVGDQIKLTKDGLNPNTPIHEYTHLWAKAMRRNNREGWQSILNIFKDTPMWQEVKEDSNYSGLQTDDAICSEVLARYSGQRGAARMEEWAQEELHEAEQSGSVLQGAKIRRLISRAKKALADFWHWVGVNLFGIKHFDSAEQVADRVLWDMLNQTELGDVSNRYSQVATDAWNKYQYDGELESVRDVADYIEENMPKDATTQPLFDAIDKYRSEEEEDRMLYGERGDLEPFEDAIFAEIEKLMDSNIERSVSKWTPEQLRFIQEWHNAHPYPQYQIGETLHNFNERLNKWKEEQAQFRAQLKSWKPTAQATEVQDRPTSAGAPAFVPGVRPTPMKDETPGEYALRLKQYYQLMRDEDLVAEYVAEINAQADAGAKVLKRNTLVRGLIDAAKPIENFQEWMKERGATMTDESNAYTDTFLATGRVTQANEQMQRDIIRPLARQIATIIAPDKETGKSRLDGLHIVWQNMDVAGTGSKLDGKELTPREIIGVYCQAKDCAEAIEQGLPDRGAKGFENNIGMTHNNLINAVESVIPAAELDKMWELIRKATHFALEYDHEAGRISDDTFEEFSKREFYVPQRGWRERDESGLISEYEPVGKRGNDPYNAALVRARGRKTLASDPFAYIMSIDASSIISSENNKIKQKFLRFCLDNENLGLKTGAFRVKKYWIMNVIDEQTGKVKLDEEGNPMMTVSYVAPTQEDFDHDKTAKAAIKEQRKQLAKVNKAFAERQAHGELGPQLEQAYKVKIAKIEQTIDDLEQSMHIAWHATNSNITQRTSDEKKQHEVRVLKDGQEYVIELQDEKLANAINKKFKQHQEELFNTTERMRNATRFMSAMLTQYNPEFAASNFARDYQVALATLVAEHPELVKPFVKNFAACQPAVWQYAFNDKVRDRASFRDSELGRYLQEYFKAGAATGFSYMQDLKSLRHDFDAMINESDLRRGIKGAVGTLSMLTEVSETAVRFAGYVSARQAGMGINEAAYLSKELTTNFDRAGEVADSGWMSWFSFFRATLNGNIKFLKALKKMPVAYSLIAASYFVMGMLNQLINPDDPDDEIWASDYTRQSNFVIGKIRIPTAHFLRMFFAAGVNSAKWLQGSKSFGEATYNTATFATQEMLPNYLNVLGNGTEWNSREQSVDFTWEGLLQGVMPSPLSPIADVYFNRDFRGATINREPFAKSQEGTKDILLSKEHTLPVYKWLTQAIYEGTGGNMNTKYKSSDPAWRSWLFDTSASSVEHVVEGYMPAGMDMFITMGEAIYDAATGTPTGPDKWPFIRKFYNAYTPERAYMQQYYLLKGRVDDFKRNLDDAEDNDRTRYDKMISSKEYQKYIAVKDLVGKKNIKENPTTADVNALIEANKSWLK